MTKKKNIMIKAIIFDCWGTLFYDDIEPKPFEEFAKKLGKSMNDYSYLKIFERNLMLKKNINIEEAIKNILRDLKIETNEEVLKELVFILKEKATSYIKLYPDTLKTLEKLKKEFKLALVTDAFPLSFKVLETKFKIRKFFDTLIISYEVGLLKPDYKMFELALKNLECKKEEALMIGNNLEDDVKAARKFGVNSILFDINNKYPEFPERITSLSEIWRYLK